MPFTFDPHRPMVMGILNVTPDSFSDGGCFDTVEAAVRRAKDIEAQGASILDIGAQSTAPHATPIAPEEEWRRLSPVLDAVRRAVSIPISVDTFEPYVAARALALGASVLNDVSGSLQNGFPALAAESGAGLIAMARGAASPLDVRRQWQTILTAATDAGLPLSCLCLDVGIGFHADRETDLAVIRQLPQLLAGLPETAVLCGASRKRVIAYCAGESDPADRTAGTIAFHTLAQANGANLLRVHDVREAVQAMRVTACLCAPPDNSIF